MTKRKDYRLNLDWTNYPWDELHIAKGHYPRFRLKFLTNGTTFMSEEFTPKQGQSVIDAALEICKEKNWK